MIIFDFDGVLSMSFSALYAINRIAAERIGKSLSEKVYRECFYGPLHLLISERLNLSSEEVARFRLEKNALFDKYYNPRSVLLYPFAPGLVSGVAKAGQLCIISSAPERVIRTMLAANKLEPYFTEIYGMNTLGKQEALNRVTTEDSTNYFITDTVGDIREAARVEKLKTIAVTWGFHGAEALESTSPDYVAYMPNQVIDFIYGHTS